MKLITIVITAGTFLLGQAQETVRTWTSTQGSTLEASFLSREGEDVELVSKDGKIFKLKFEQLSDQDQEFITSSSVASKAPDRKKKNNNSSWENWDEDWPKHVKTKKGFPVDEGTPIDVLETHQYVYDSPHFSFYSDIKLSITLIEKFSWYFETTFDYMAQIPLSMSITQEEERHKIILFRNKSDYFISGGPANSAGVYIPSQELILVPFESIGVKKAGQGFTYDSQSSSKTLAHEIVHILTDKPYYQEGLRGWFTEGLAEYISVTPYSPGFYKPISADGAVEAYVTSYGKEGKAGRNLGEEIKVGSLQGFMLQSYSDFLSNGNYNYGIGALLVAYFVDLKRDEELENLQNTLKAAKTGKKGAELLTVLLNGRTFAELEKEIASAWRGKGVKLEFSE